MLRALGEGRDGAEAVRLLRNAQRSKNLMLIRAVVQMATTRGHPDAPTAMRAYRVLLRLHEQTPEPVDRALRSPLVSAWALHAALQLRRFRPVRLDVWRALQPLRYPPRIQVDNDGVRLDALLLSPAQRRYLPDIEPDIEADDEVWSDHDKLATWRTRIASGWRLLVRHHRTVAEEVSSVITMLAPLVEPPAGPTSGTFRHAFGLIAMSLPPDARAAAVTFAHEVQHAKLAALMDLFRLVEPGGELYYAPWRTDPRPLPALLQGAYAHLGVAGFWRIQRRLEREAGLARRAEVEFARWRAAAEQATRVILESGRLTSIGNEFVTAMAERLTRWRDEPLPPGARAEAARLLHDHHARWRVRDEPVARDGGRSGFATPAELNSRGAGIAET